MHVEKLIKQHIKFMHFMGVVDDILRSGYIW